MSLLRQLTFAASLIPIPLSFPSAIAGSCDKFVPGGTFRNYVSNLKDLETSYDETLQILRDRAKTGQFAFDRQIDLDHRVAIASFTNIAYEKVNPSLRHNTVDEEKLRPFVDCLSEALSLLPKFRGLVRRISRPLPKDVDAKHRQGKRIHYAAFTSSSARPDFFEWMAKEPGNEDFYVGHHLELYLWSETGRDISKYSINNLEQEILFPASTCFRVDSRKELANKTVLRANEVKCR